MNQKLREIFRKGSKTYFNSSLFFPRAVREDVFVLYAFVRIADNYVDAVPQDGDGFYAFRDAYRDAMKGKPSGETVIDGFVELSRKLEFDPAWADAFLDAMEMDLYKKEYRTLEELWKYVYGSAEVIGLFMARILRLCPESAQAARMQGRAMQLINFIRDLNEDLGFGRVYLPLDLAGIKSLDRETAYSEPGAFNDFVRRLIALYSEIQKEAEEGYRYIPWRTLIPIKTASDMYNWTARVIENNPLIVYDIQVKPPKILIILTVIKNAFTLIFRKKT